MIWLKKLGPVSISVHLLGFILFLFLAITIPPNMDEFFSYRQIMCYHFPFGQLSQFRDACGMYDLTLFGIELPIRSYGYAGSSPSLLYYPFYLMWPSYISARMIDFFALIAIIWALRKLTHLSYISSGILVFLSYPLMISTVIDTGPISLQLAAALLLPVLAMKVKKHWQGVVLGLFAFIALWHKTFFVVAIPAMLLMCFETYKLLPAREKQKTILTMIIDRIKLLSGGIAIASVLLILLFVGKDKLGNPYYSKLFQVGESIPFFDFSQQLQHLIEKFQPFVVSQTAFAHRVHHFANFQVLHEPLTSTIWLLMAGLLIWGIWKRPKIRKPLIISICSFILTLFFINRIKESWASHHIILAYIFLLLALAYIFKELEDEKFKIGRIFIGIYALCGIFLFNHTFKLPINSRSSWSRIKINHYLSDEKVAEKYAYVVLDWGIFFHQALYGPKNQMVFWLEPLNKDELSQLKFKLEESNRKAIFILHKPTSTNLHLLTSSFKNLTLLPYPHEDSSDDWWLMVEKDRKPDESFLNFQRDNFSLDLKLQ